MPFVSKAQARACYARQRANPKSDWDCEEWAKGTDWSKLPERSSSSSKIKKSSSSKKTSSLKLRKKSSPRKPKTIRMNKKSGKKPK